MALIIVDAMMPCKFGKWHCRALASVKPNQRHAKHVTPKLDGVSLQNAKSRDVRASKSSRLHPQREHNNLYPSLARNIAQQLLGAPYEWTTVPHRRGPPKVALEVQKKRSLGVGISYMGYLHIMIQPACYLAFLQKANLTCSCLMISTFWSPYLSICTYTYTYTHVYIYNDIYIYIMYNDVTLCF
jgi:hypothetical protein